MKRRIFVGSSTESIDKAHAICQVIDRMEDTESVIWTTQFQPGYLTFEALEEMMHQCTAAVFIAAGDDTGIIRGQQVKMPRGNILLEFGLVAGRMGRHSIALCRFDGVELPSDLRGLTVIEMDRPEGHARAEEELRIWSSRLIATPDTIARTDIVHGYSGRWDFQLTLTRWRDFAIHPPDYAQVNGYLNLMVAPGGQAGGGMAHGRLFFKLLSQEGAEPWQGEFRTAHEITEAICHKDGGIEFVTQAFALHRMNSIGSPPLQLTGMGVAPEPWSSRWQLQPDSQPRTLSGSVCTEEGGFTEGKVKLVKSVSGP